MSSGAERIRSRIEIALGLRANPTVFFTAAGLIAVFVVVGAVFPRDADALFGAVQAFVTNTLGWLFHLSVTLFLVFAVWLALSRHGKVRLGNDDERPAYNRASWLAMMFSAGMGIGVLFWSVAEPLTHYQKPPVGEGLTPAAATLAMNLTLLHWGFHGWGIYAVAGLALAYFAYRRGLPLTMRSAFRPLLGRHTDGPAGHAIDVFAVLGTMFGVATSLGLGAQQTNAALGRLAGLADATSTQLLIIAGITALATVSVVSGVDRGIRRLSELTMILAALLFIYLLVTGPTAQTVTAAAASFGQYVAALAQRLLWSSMGGDARWQSDWTVFYWGWWISWSPFVGMFVARISRGRTVREFLLGVLLVPSTVCCVWFAVFGSMALQMVQGGDDALARAVLDAYATSIFVFFDRFPLPTLLSVVGAALVVVFFVTSSDSASLVIDYITSGGDQDPPVRQRVFWAVSEGGVASVLLVTGGLGPMRAFQIITGLPLCLILLAMCVSIVRALRSEPVPPAAA